MNIDTVVRTLFPDGPPLPPNLPLPIDARPPPYVTMEELNSAVRRAPRGKAPGPDRDPTEVIQEVAIINPNLLIGLFDRGFRDGELPISSKVARLVLLPKGPPSPSVIVLCLINTWAKLLERVVANRITNIVEQQGGLSQRQFGFRQGRSTIDAIK